MPLMDGLIGYWPFDESGGDQVIDRSGHGNHGLILNGGRSAGIYGGAISLLGRDDSHVTIDSSPIFDRIALAVTVSAWVFPVVEPVGFKVAVSRQVGELLHPDQFYLGFGPLDGAMHYKWHIGTEVDGAHREGDVYRGVPEHGRWIHLAGTYDGAVMRLYVDGAEIGSAAIGGQILVGANPITIGGEENGPASRVVDGEFEGSIDEVRLYDRALSAEEIAALFAMDR